MFSEKETLGFIVGVAVIFIAMYVALGFISHQQTQCKIAYSESTKSVDEIAKLCK